ncbi:hypothetical protein [Ruania halotolerans]|uniref:hypothetical protein n=1 Tax=Ruania halotolerans TaxID=2897773 RepID=UPI001E59FF3C|nr:hypothetical protein [Ruania halotolerans]UFU05480.1 hypothetical protein LQF10_13625 [Ruania halotolerans]
MNGWDKVVEGVPMDSALAWVAAIAASVTALATIGLVYGAVSTLGKTREQLQLLREQVVREGRPYVGVEAAPGLHGAGAWDLRIHNYGRTAAHRVTLHTQELEPQNDEDHIVEPLKRYLATERWLAPGKSERVMWRRGPEPYNPKLEAGAPAQADVRVRYESETGTPYEATFHLDVDSIGAVAPVPTNGPTAHGKDVELKNVENAVRTLAVHVGELRR